eukprot:SAG31_NODE_16_length_36206_cov_27.355728_14_plen_236_part_00
MAPTLYTWLERASMIAISLVQVRNVSPDMALSVQHPGQIVPDEAKVLTGLDEQTVAWLSSATKLFYTWHCCEHAVIFFPLASLPAVLRVVLFASTQSAYRVQTDVRTIRAWIQSLRRRRRLPKNLACHNCSLSIHLSTAISPLPQPKLELGHHGGTMPTIVTLAIIVCQLRRARAGVLALLAGDGAMPTVQTPSPVAQIVSSVQSPGRTMRVALSHRHLRPRRMSPSNPMQLFRL